MDWSRLEGAGFDALLIAFTLGGILSPPDPFTQLLYALPAFLVALPAIYRYGQRSVGPWWRRYLVFVGGVLACALAWRLLGLAVGTSAVAGVRPAFLLVGVALGAWLAYFGGVEKIRASDEASGHM